MSYWVWVRVFYLQAESEKGKQKKILLAAAHGASLPPVFVLKVPCGGGAARWRKCYGIGIVGEDAGRARRHLTPLAPRALALGGKGHLISWCFCLI